MALAYSGTNVSARGTSAALATASISVSGSNPALIIGFSMDTSGGNPTVNSVTFGGTGTPAVIQDEVISGCRTLIYAVPAPSGSGVVTVNLSASTPIQIDVTLWTGVDQTTPCPVSDAVVNGGTTNPPGSTVTLTPTNVGVNDAAYGCQGHTITNDCSGVTPNAIVTDSTTAVNFQDGYQTGSGGVTFPTIGSGAMNWAAVAVRIQAPAGAPTPTTPPTPFGNEIAPAAFRLWGVCRWEGTESVPLSRRGRARQRQYRKEMEMMYRRSKSFNRT